jgi:hypothetical protein
LWLNIAMPKDTLQFSVELIEVAVKLHSLGFRHKWCLGDQFCVVEDCEIFWQNLASDRVYLIDENLINLMEEFVRQGIPLGEETGVMVFIPRLEDIIEFCAASIFALELTVALTQQNQPLYRARLTIPSQDKVVCEESSSGLRLAALRALAAALQNYLQPVYPTGSLPAPI